MHFQFSTVQFSYLILNFIPLFILTPRLLFSEGFPNPDVYFDSPSYVGPKSNCAIGDIQCQLAWTSAFACGIRGDCFFNPHGCKTTPSIPTHPLPTGQWEWKSTQQSKRGLKTHLKTRKKSIWKEWTNIEGGELYKVYQN